MKTEMWVHRMATTNTVGSMVYEKVPFPSNNIYTKSESQDLARKQQTNLAAMFELITELTSSRV